VAPLPPALLPLAAGGMFRSSLRHAALAMLGALALLLARPATAQVMADWGTVATPISSPVTFSFAQYDVKGNFSHEYVFTLEGSADAAYSVSLQFDACRAGCGNAVLHYGIGGSLSESPTGAYVLAPGTYAFTVSATGMGAGNIVDYFGSVVISGAPGGVVSPVPEPEIFILAIPGAMLVVAAARRRRRQERGGAGAPAGARLGLPKHAAPAAMLLAAPLLLFLSGCAGEPGELPTQVVARVGSTEISALQVDLAMKLQRGPVPGESNRQEIIDKLIDRELAVQQALARKLDRQPEVMLRLEELRRELLAGAFAEQVAAARPRPTEQGIRAFYAGQPELFAQRKIYHLRELVIPVSSTHLAQAKERLANRQPLSETIGWLTREGARFSQQDVLRAAEQVPLEALRKLHGLSEGQTAIFEAPQAVYVYQVLGFESAPLDLAAATPLIANHLARQEGDRAMRAELKTLRTSANIEILGAAPARPSPLAKSGT
jgi:EpsD family peptidyl-prolyl cis-trans isomerase